MTRTSTRPGAADGLLHSTGTRTSLPPRVLKAAARISLRAKKVEGRWPCGQRQWRQRRRSAATAGLAASLGVAAGHQAQCQSTRQQAGLARRPWRPVRTRPLRGLGRLVPQEVGWQGCRGALHIDTKHWGQCSSKPAPCRHSVRRLSPSLCVQIYIWLRHALRRHVQELALVQWKLQTKLPRKIHLN